MKFFVFLCLTGLTLKTSAAVLEQPNEEPRARSYITIIDETSNNTWKATSSSIPGETIENEIDHLLTYLQNNPSEEFPTGPFLYSYAILLEDKTLITADTVIPTQNNEDPLPHYFVYLTHDFTTKEAL